jgi:ubiquinone/menaquinone biosynthesis C-methylase UbiE
VTSDDGRVAQVARRYSSDADTYSRCFAPVLHRVSAGFVRELPLHRARVIIDTGSGVGSLLGDLRAAAPEALVIGIDLAEGMLRVARASGESALVAGDLRALPVRDGGADVITNAFMLQHIPEPQIVFAEMRRIVRTDGLAGILTWAPLGKFEAEEVWKATLDEAGAPELTPPVANHRLFDSPEKMTALLSGAGFTTVESSSAAFSHEWDVPTFLAWVTGAGMSRRRFEALDPSARDRVLATMRTRLTHMDAGALTLPLPVVFSVARA